MYIIDILTGDEYGAFLLEEIVPNCQVYPKFLSNGIGLNEFITFVANESYKTNPNKSVTISITEGCLLIRELEKKRSINRVLGGFEINHHSSPCTNLLDRWEKQYLTTADKDNIIKPELI